jgi:chromosome segregation ATPase
MQNTDTKLRPPGLGWLGVLLALALLALAIQGFGLFGHLDLLKEKSSWMATSDQREKQIVDAQLQLDSLAKRIEGEKQALSDWEGKKGQAAAEAAAAEKETQRLSAQLQTARKDLELSETALDKAVAERRESLASHDALKSECERLGVQATNLTAQVADLGTQLAVLQETIASNTEAKAAAEKTLVTTVGQITAAQSRLDALLKETGGAQQAAAAAQTQAQDASRRLSATTAELEASRVAHSNQLAAVLTLRTEKAQLEATTTNLHRAKLAQSAEVDRLQSRVSSLKTEAAAYIDEAGKTATARANVSNELARLALLQQERKQLADDIARTKGEATAVAEQKAEATTELAALQKRLSTLKADAQGYMDETAKLAATRVTATNEVQRVTLLQQEARQLADDIARSKAEIRTLTDTKSQLSGDVAALRREQAELAETLKALTTSVTDLAKKARDAARDLATAKPVKEEK